MSERPRGEVIANRALAVMAKYSEAAGDLPRGGDDYEYHMSFRGFKQSTRRHADKLLDVIDVIGTAHVASKDRFSGVGSNWMAEKTADKQEGPAAATGNGDDGKKKKKIKKPSMLEEQRQIAVMDLVDSLLEAVDSSLDEARGEKMKNISQLNVQFGSGGTDGSTAGFGAHAMKQRIETNPEQTSLNPNSLLHQSFFTLGVDNSPENPFKPMIYPLVDVEAGTDCEALGASKNPPARGVAGIHPYKNMIESFTYPDWVLQASPEQGVPPLDSTPLVPVETVEDLKAMILAILEPLSSSESTTEIAVDLEHHNQHSFQGYTCLMQLSTRTTDYIVDVIGLRDYMHLLNKSVLLNPRILKVLHGAVEDIRWLQKDFGCYMVNFFDTGIALQNLQMPHGLAFAVDHFCSVKLDKKYQTADWRIRPLPHEYIQYARMDTHFLLYIYDRLKLLLLNADTRTASAAAASAGGNLLMSVLKQSRQLSLTCYEKPKQDKENGYREAMGRSLGGLTPNQLKLVQLLYNWRDEQARSSDESPPSVMHARCILQLACKGPTSPSEIVRAAQPVSAIFRKSVPEIAEIIRSCADIAGDSSKEETASPLEAQASFAGQDSEMVKQQKQRSFLATGNEQRFARHRPMTGTLPSIEPNFNTSTILSGVTTAAAGTPAAGSSSSWLGSLGNGAGSASTIVAPVLPMSLLKPPKPALQRQQTTATSVADLKDRSVGGKSERHEETEEERANVAPSGFSTNTSTGAGGGDESTPFSPLQDGQVVLPKAVGDEGERDTKRRRTEEEDGKQIISLKNEYKGLGRDTRRREAKTAEASTTNDSKKKVAPPPPKASGEAKKPAGKKGGKRK